MIKMAHDTVITWNAEEKQVLKKKSSKCFLHRGHMQDAQVFLHAIATIAYLQDKLLY